jgi:C-terminal processing protease CtpA/Prc
MDMLRTYYVFPEVAEEICIALQHHLADGDYEDIAEDLLAYALTTHMQEVCHDEHLWVKWHSEPLPDEDEALRQSEAWAAQEQLRARIGNHGIHKVERMAGNIGLIEIRRFPRPEWGGETAVAALHVLANTDALIVDLRRCTGGYPGMVQLISTYLLGGEPVHLLSIYWRDEDATRQYWTLPHVPGPSLADKPLTILTGKETFSGGENLAYDMQARGRALIIGEQTDGGAHPGALYRLTPHLEASIPIGLPTHPLTGGNWEGVGVTPDVPVPSERALSVAYKMALEVQIERLGKPPSGPLRLLLAEARVAYKRLVDA